MYKIIWIIGIGIYYIFSLKSFIACSHKLQYQAPILTNYIESEKTKKYLSLKIKIVSKHNEILEFICCAEKL